MVPSSSRTSRAFRIATPSRTWSKKAGTSKNWCYPTRCAGTSRIASFSTATRPSFLNDFFSIRSSRAVQRAGQVRVQQTVEEMLAGFAVHGEAPGHIGARAEPALHSLTDGHVFILHFFAHLDALFVLLQRLF